MATKPGQHVDRGWTRLRGLWRHLYFWVLLGVLAGALVGLIAPGFGASLKPAGDMFISLVKMIITPIVFLTVVLGLTSANNLGKVGKVGLKALVYFQLLTGFALLIGLTVGNVIRPGSGMNVDPAHLDPGSIAKYEEKSHGVADFFTGLVPDSVVGAFAEGNILQVLLFSILFGIAASAMGTSARPVLELFAKLQRVFFGVLRLIMYFAPIGAFGAVAYTTGKHGVGALGNLGLLLIAFYVTCVLFIVVVLGTIIRLCGLSLWRMLRYFRHELLVTLATTSTETVLPQTMQKLTHLGCGRSVVNLTVPAGYSFNLDGAAIYLTLTSMFIAQALNIDLTAGQQVTLILIALLTSKGGAGVAGAALAVLTATLSAIGTVPVAGVALIVGIDRFMNEIRAITNLVGNIVATVVVARWEAELDVTRARAVLAGQDVEPIDLADADDVDDDAPDDQQRSRAVV